MIPYGLQVLTARHGEEMTASTVTWISQASFEPPLIMAAIRADGSACAAIKASRSFAVNFCGEDQKSFAADFFKSSVQAGNRLNGHEFEFGETGSPLFLETPASIECEVASMVEAGDHTVFVAKVIHATSRFGDPGLLLRNTGWNYGG